VIFGDYAGDQLLAAALGLVRPGPGEFVSARLARRARAVVAVGGGTGAAGDGSIEPDPYARFIRLDGGDWVLARTGDPVGPAPTLPR
jgi:hypothetical protein